MRARMRCFLFIWLCADASSVVCAVFPTPSGWRWQFGGTPREVNIHKDSKECNGKERRGLRFAAACMSSCPCVWFSFFQAHLLSPARRRWMGMLSPCLYFGKLLY
ncbi:unnamed protein product [Ectocarpus sp. 6 AP-2014]